MNEMQQLPRSRDHIHGLEHEAERLRAEPAHAIADTIDGAARNGAPRQQPGSRRRIHPRAPRSRSLRSRSSPCRRPASASGAGWSVSARRSPGRGPTRPTRSAAIREPRRPMARRYAAMQGRERPCDDGPSTASHRLRSPSMRLWLQLPSFCISGRAHGDRADPRRDRPGRRSGRVRQPLGSMDHWFQLARAAGWGGPEQPMLEAYTTLGSWPGRRTRSSLGPLVAGVHFRHPGRTREAGDHARRPVRRWAHDARPRSRLVRPEARGLGFPFPPPAERFARLEETLRIARAMFTGDRAPIAGDHYRLEEPINVPAPLAGQPADPRRRQRRRAGRRARRPLRHASNFPDLDPGESRRLVQTIRPRRRGSRPGSARDRDDLPGRRGPAGRAGCQPCRSRRNRP